MNVKMNLGEIGWNGMDQTDLTQDRDWSRALINMNLWVPYNAGKCKIGGLSRRAQLRRGCLCVILINLSLVLNGNLMLNIVMLVKN
jgi:hypothetical protein